VLIYGIGAAKAPLSLIPVSNDFHILATALVLDIEKNGPHGPV